MSSTVDLDKVARIASARQAYLLVWNAILVWDWLVTLPTEISAIWKQKRTVLKYLFLLNRYGTLILCLATCVTVITPMSNETCSKVYWIQMLEVAFVLWVCHSILAVRLFAIYERNNIMKWCLVGFLTVETSVAIAACSMFAPLDLPRFVAKYIQLEGCLTSPRASAPRDIVLSLNILPAIYDTSVLILTAARNIHVTRKIGTQLPVLRRQVSLLFDGILYYLIITATHVVTAILWFQNDPAVKTFNVPASIVLG
ncbi:hypothetical protein JCM10212_005502 [Sporobolomyces blumeae]